MIDVEDLIALIRNYNPHSDEDMIRRAYAYGAMMHEGQTRHSGEPYFTHPVEVAAILTEMQLDDATIVTALLHDTIEDTRSTWSEVSELFGAEVADLVDGVTKLTKLQLSGSHSKQAENFRKLFIAMTRDMRVLLVKLADRLHNMRTIRAMRPDKQVQKARETMDIYAPLAGRVGMQGMREELEDLAFKVINREARQSIIRRFVTLQRESGDVISKITADIRTELDKAGIDADVYGRAKRPFSVWRKMQEKQLAFSRLSDIYGFRIITRSEEDCYRTLGLIHSRWRAVPGRFKDYISQPKSNGYRSIHTTVSGRDGKRVEVQIRTRQMHEVAESGVAAHWSYRDGVRSNNPFAVDPSQWIATMSERLGDEDHDEFLEHFKLEMYADQVFCFTPKGDVIPLPKGATAIDFAYAIHTRVGNAFVGAKVDGIRTPMWTKLRNGQMVDVITASGQRPELGWLEMVATGRAKSAIRRSLREADRERYVKLGAELLRVAFEHHARKLTDKALRTAAEKLALPSADEMLARVGTSDLAAQEVLAALYPELEPRKDIIDPAHPIAGLTADQRFERASCCLPLPGERIVGISQPGRGLVLHAIDCPSLELHEDELDRWVDLRWREGDHPPVYTVPLDIVIRHDAGVLGRICTLIGGCRANISDLQFVDRKPDFYRLRIDVDLRDHEQLHVLLTALEAESDVAQITRIREPAPYAEGLAAARAKRAERAAAQ
ncbi:MAG: bifunctional (p)ppGpp synthetase/guanosine-3',5'-bis(diphosphate) 3'-pyrophosphohydrolase [Paracoccus sp. (in: a-proteobacteria)]|nr:bifunctional (p)ppGpp synthetase/guanosine-3',5'-bis(diphosphate) 3'-pyrophosphohydrolase [Paracoccus sp. (in: a-proteobacteria)]